MRRKSLECNEHQPMSRQRRIRSGPVDESREMPLEGLTAAEGLHDDDAGAGIDAVGEVPPIDHLILAQ